MYGLNDVVSFCCKRSLFSFMRNWFCCVVKRSILLSMTSCVCSELAFRSHDDTFMSMPSQLTSCRWKSFDADDDREVRSFGTKVHSSSACAANRRAGISFLK